VTSGNKTGLLDILRRGDLAVVGLGALLLLVGWVVRSSHIDRTERHRFGAASLVTPAGWVSMPAEDGRQVLADVLVADTFKPRVTVSMERLPKTMQLGGRSRKARELESYVALNLQSTLNLYHPIASKALTLAGRRAVRLDYAHAVNPAARPDDPAATDIPVAVRATTLAVLVGGGRLLRVSVEQSVAQHDRRPGLADRVIASIELSREVKP
jgi:hypothetical protein